MWMRSFLLPCCVLGVLITGAKAEVIVIISGQQALVVTRMAERFTSSQIADQVFNLNGGDQPQPPPPQDGSLQELSARWKTVVPNYVKKDAHRLALAALHSALVTRISSGGITDLDQLSTQTRQLRDVFLGDDKDKWAAWASPIGERLSQITTLQDMSIAYQQIASGLSEGEALSPIVLMVMDIILNVLEKRGVNPELLELVRTVLNLLGGFTAEGQPLEESSLPDPPGEFSRPVLSEESSHKSHSVRYSGGGQGLVAVRPGYIDLRTRRW